MKAIFDTRAESGYDDDVAHYYPFPRRYLTEAQKAVGDWVIYREPRRGGGREGYVAIARVVRIEPDPVIATYARAIVSAYWPFDSVVPLRKDHGFYEDRLDLVGVPAKLGAALQGRSIRVISDIEFNAIVRAGFAQTLSPANARRLGLDAESSGREVAELVYALPDEQERRIAQVLLNRKFRDAAFRRAVLAAYDDRCAVTGLRIINGGGRAEAQAAHIVPVAVGGLDVVQNGIALSATAHWLFDRHLISLTDDYGLLVSHNRVPGDLRELFSRQLARIHLPADRKLWPYPLYIQRHREAYVG